MKDEQATAVPGPAEGAAPVSSLYGRASRAAWLGLVVNIALAAVKLVAGILGHSIALIADAVNSIGDGLSSAVIIYGLGVAQRPADAEHPYGHSRAESVAAVSVAVLIATSAIALAIETLRGFGAWHPVPPVWTLWIAAANVVIKESMYRYKRRVAERTGSQAIVAGAWDHRSDALCSAAVLVGLGIVRYGGASVIWADEVAALVVVVLILFSAIKLFGGSASQLLDEQCDDAMVDAIRSLAEEVPGVVRVEKVRARRSGIEALVDIHIEVDGTLSVEDGHGIAHDVQERLVNGITQVAAVLVHVEPA